MNKKIAVILIRGVTKVRHDLLLTLRCLNLFNKNNCVILDATPVNMGMINKVKDLVTYGEVSDETVIALSKKRKIMNKTYCLHPPRGGFERKGLKIAFVNGGVLGKRTNIDVLIKKML